MFVFTTTDQETPLKTLRGLYIEKRRIAPALFEQDMLKHTLYPHARLLRSLMPLSVRQRYFDLDLEFVRAIGGSLAANVRNSCAIR